MIGDKGHRQRAILELVKSQPIHTQEELVQELRRLDHPVTQATVSRDIRELGLFREPGPSGSRYAVRGGLGLRAGQVLRDFITSVDGVQFMAVVRTPPGTANLVAVAIDEAGWPEVLGTLAGDDTVLVISPDARTRKALVQRLLAVERESVAALGNGR
jgi:transcriptional regulator of arginine metabolism